MTTSRQTTKYFQAIRRLHRLIAPIMLLPLLLTAITGTVYQLVDSVGKDREFRWLLS